MHRMRRWSRAPKHFYSMDAHTHLSSLCVPAALKPHTKTLLLSWGQVLPKRSTKRCCSEIFTGTQDQPLVPLRGETQPGEGPKTLRAHPSLRVGHRPLLQQPWDAPGPKTRSSSSPAAAGFCQPHALRENQAAGCLSCAILGDKTGCPHRGLVLSGWLSGNGASGKACG